MMGGGGGGGGALGAIDRKFEFCEGEREFFFLKPTYTCTIGSYWVGGLLGRGNVCVWWKGKPGLCMIKHGACYIMCNIHTSNHPRGRLKVGEAKEGERGLGGTGPQCAEQELDRTLTPIL